VKLSRDQFNDFINSKKTGTYKCPVCSHEVFTFLGGGPAHDLSIAALEMTDQQLSDSSHYFAAMSCANCGHTTLFLRRLIREWLEKRGEKNG
jgi:hypothetical protein